jgi:hypothetical protein
MASAQWHLQRKAKGQVIFRVYSGCDLIPLARLWLESWLSTSPNVENAVTEDSNRERIIIREISSGWKVTIASEANEIVGFLAINRI